MVLISEFVRATGLTPDTVRLYVRRGLLKPLTGRRDQVFTDEHVQMARRL
jgi:MerR family transcriptional regulator, copper efflux regulator